jgi:hypothetical protein
VKLPSPSVYWIDMAGVVVMALLTAGIYISLVGPTLDLRAREDELNARLASMRSNLGALRTRNREFEGRVADARAVVEAQPPLERSDALLTRRAAITSLLADHNLVLDEFKSEPARPGARRAQPSSSGGADEQRSFERHTLILRGEGTFPDITATATDIRQRFSDMLVESVEISGHPFGSSDQRQFTLRVVWYASAS